MGSHTLLSLPCRGNPIVQGCPCREPGKTNPVEKQRRHQHGGQDKYRQANRWV